MLKPQIALAFALPFNRRPQRKGLVIGLAGLLGLGVGALIHTNVSPLRYLEVGWGPDRFSFAHAGTMNLMHLLGPAAAAFLLLVLAGICGMGLVAKGAPFHATLFSSLSRALDGGAPTLKLQGLYGVTGSVALYHHPYDNIMLYPALLAMFALALRERGLWSTVLAITMAITLWTPLHWVANSPVFQVFSTAVWVLVGLTLLLQPCPSASPALGKA